MAHLPRIASGRPAENHLPDPGIIGKNNDISVEHASQMTTLLPHGYLDIVAGGHSTPITHSDLVNQAISEFLELSDSNQSDKRATPMTLVEQANDKITGTIGNLKTWLRKFFSV